MEDLFVATAAREMRNAAGDAYGEWVGGLREWPYFATLTYDPVKIARARGFRVERGAIADPTGARLAVGLSKMRRDVHHFIRQLGEALDGVDLVAGIEPHEADGDASLRGSLHAHCLVNPRRGVRMGDKVAMHEAWFKRNGFIRVDDVHDVGGAAMYVAKFQRVASYALKHQGDIVFSNSLRGG